MYKQRASALVDDADKTVADLVAKVQAEWIREEVREVAAPRLIEPPPEFVEEQPEGVHPTRLSGNWLLDDRDAQSYAEVSDRRLDPRCKHVGGAVEFALPEVIDPG